MSGDANTVRRHIYEEQLGPDVNKVAALPRRSRRNSYVKDP